MWQAWNRSRKVEKMRISSRKYEGKADYIVDLHIDSRQYYKINLQMIDMREMD